MCIHCARFVAFAFIFDKVLEKNQCSLTFVIWNSDTVLLHLFWFGGKFLGLIRGCFVNTWIGMPYRRTGGEGNGTQHSCLENPMDGGAWWASVHRVAKSRTRLSDFTFTFHFHALEKEMSTHSSVLAWRIPGTGEPGGLPSMGSHRVGHDWGELAAVAAA